MGVPVLAVCLAQPLRSDYRQSPSTMTPSHVRSRELELEPEHPAEAEQAHQVSHSTGGDAGSTGEEPLVGEGEMEMGPQAGPGAADGQSAPPDGAAVIPEDDRERKRGGAHRRGRVDWGTIQVGAWRHGVTLTVG